MGALTFAIDQMKPGSAGDNRQVIGTLTFSDAYATGGDTFDPADLGLMILDSMEIEVGNNGVDNTPLQPRCANAVPIMSTKASGGSPSGRVTAYAIPGTPAANIGTEVGLAEIDNGTDLSAFSARFVAYGV